MIRNVLLKGGAVLLLTLLIITGIVIFRTVSMSYELEEVEETEEYVIPKEKAMERLRKSLIFETVSEQHTEDIDYQEFTDFINWIDTAYENINEELDRRIINDYTLIYHWEGQNNDQDAVVFLGHYDVVPVYQEHLGNWETAPFKGEIMDDYVYGRGAIDDKSGCIAYMEAMDFLLNEDFTPSRDIYILLTHDEERGGLEGAKKAAEWFEENNIQIATLIDEGMPVAQEILPGISSPLALIGVAEKGNLNLELELEIEGGHASMPDRQNPIEILSESVINIRENPMRGRFRGLIHHTFEPLSPELPFVYRMGLANLWLFEGVIERRLSEIRHTNAALRTTIAPTVFKSGVKNNVLPAQSEAILNIRVHPQDDLDKARDHVRNHLTDDRIEVQEFEGATEPSSIADIEKDDFRSLRKAIKQTFPRTPVVPSMFLAATDSRHFRELADDIYRFRPVRAFPEDAKRIHGDNERLGIQNFYEMIQFNIRFMKNLSEDNR